MDGTLNEAAASLKSFKPKDGDPPKTTDDDPGNPSVDFHGDRRSNATHQSTTDPEARLLRKGKGKEAKLVFMAHASHVHPPVLVLQRRVMRKHAQVFFFSYGPFIMGDSHSFVASFKIRPRVTL